MDKDSKVILDELAVGAHNLSLIELVKNVRDSQKHFYLFLQNSRNVLTYNSTKNKENKKPPTIDKQNILSLLTDFNNELMEYVSAVNSLEALKETKEKMFPYSNMAILDDFKKINSLALIIKLLKKENRTEAEEIKIKVSRGLTRPFWRTRRMPLSRLTRQVSGSGRWEPITAVESEHLV